MVIIIPSTWRNVFLPWKQVYICTLRGLARHAFLCYRIQEPIDLSDDEGVATMHWMHNPKRDGLGRLLKSSPGKSSGADSAGLPCIVYAGGEGKEGSHGL